LALLFDFTKKDILRQTGNKQNDFLAVQSDRERLPTSSHRTLYTTKSHSFRHTANKRQSKHSFSLQNLFQKPLK